MLTAGKRKLVKTLKDSCSVEEIAQILECDVESVTTCIKDHESHDDKVGKIRVRNLPMDNSRSVGRPKVFENRQLVEQMLLKHPQYTSIDVQRELQSQYGIEVSRRTLQRRISEIKSRQFELKNGGLTPEVKKRRLAWARAHEDWTVQDWHNVFNMDDFKAPDDFVPKEIYVDTLVGPDSPQCNDLNLLEQLMAIIEPKIQNRDPTTADSFRAIIYEIWHTDEDMVNRINMLYESMIWRVNSVIQSGGAETGLN